MSSGPIPDSYWVVPGGLLAGEYPGSLVDEEARSKLEQLLAAGITLFLDLTEEGELCPYAHMLRDTHGYSANYCRMPVRDLDTPARATMERILNIIDQSIATGGVVYVHCWGGVGRTGTVVGCFLVRRGMAGQTALEEIARLRRNTPDGWKRSPETESQRQMVLNWRSPQ